MVSLKSTDPVHLYSMYSYLQNVNTVLLDSRLGHPADSSLRKESTAELMLLTLVWDKTASGTTRSKTGNGLHS